MVLKAQRALGSALVRSPTTSKAEATINILYLPRRYAWQLFLFDFLRIQIRRTQLLMPFICLFFLSLLETEAMQMCGVPGRAENGTQISLYSAELYNPGQKTEYSCQSGLALLGGDSIRTCQNDGSWSGSRPRCVDNLAFKKAVASSRVVNHYRPDLIVDGNTRSCIYLDTRIDDRFIQIDLKKNYLISGLVIHVPDGYEQQLTVFIAEKLESAPGIQYRRCTPGISHINSPKLQIDCRGEHGSVAVPGRFLHIRDERQVHDFYFALCEIEIYGLPALPLSCGLPDLPAFATSVNHTQMMEEKHRNTFELTCQTGFLLQGSKVLRCVDGNWIGSEAAQCVAVECDPLVPVINGQIDLFPTRGLSNNSFNSVARHRCLEGFMIFGGDVTRTCGLDGRWTGTPPFCRPTDCQLPRPILNAVYKLVDNHTKPGAIAQYTCFNGYVPQRILADKPLQTAVVCQQSGVWKEGNFYCALRTTYYPPVSISFSSTTTEISSEPTEELVSPGTLISTTAPDEQTSFIQEIEFVQPLAVTISSVELGEMNVNMTTNRTNSSDSIVNSEEASESTRSTGTAIAATGFVVVFIVFFLMVAVGITLNVCRMRTAFEKAKKRFLLASTNLLLINTSDSSTKEGVCNTNNESEGGNRKHQVVVKLESEPVYNELNDSFQKPDFHLQSSPTPLSSEEESTYLDIDIDKDVKTENDSFKYCAENFSLQCDSYQNESSFIDSRPSLTPDEILLLYAKVDKSKKTKNRIYSNKIPETASIDSNCKVERNNGIENFAHEIDDAQKCHLQKSLSKFRDFHPKKVNDLQLPKTVVDVSLNEFYIEHSRIRYKEKNTVTHFQEGRPLPALPSREEKRISQENENISEHNEEITDSQNIYATLPSYKSC